MKQHRYFTLLIFLLTSLFSYSQNGKYTLSGKIVDGEGASLPGANIIITREKDSTTNGTTANRQGMFTLTGLPGGNYHIVVSYLGFDDYAQDVTMDKDVSLGEIRLSKATQTLGEVTVMGKYTDIKPSGDMVIRVAGNPLAKGQTFMEFLRNIPQLNVTDQEVKVRGRGNTLFYLDDRPIDFDQFKALSPNMISRVEVVPHANARYGVNATGGVVKVYLRETGGLLGSASFSGQGDKHGYVTGTPRVNLLYAIGKFTVSNMARVTPYSHYVSKYEQDNGEGRDLTTTDIVNRDRVLNDNLSMRYAFGKSDWIDLFGSVYLLKEDYRTNSTTGSENLLMGNDRRMGSYNAGLQWRKGFGKHDSYFQLHTLYSKENDKTGADFTLNQVSEPAKQHSDRDNISVMPELYWNITEDMTLNTGAMFAYFKDRHEDAGTQTFDYIADNDYTNMGRDYGAWVEYSVTLNKKLYLRAGLNYHGTKNEYNDRLDPSRSLEYYEDGLYPTLMGQWTFDREKSHYLSLGYRHYYSLPNYYYQIPAMNWQSENMYAIGNPDLRKENYDNLELTYSNRAWWVSYTCNYGDNMVNVIMRQDADRPGTFYTRPENTGNRLQHRLMVGYANRIAKFWYTNTTLYGSYVNENMRDNGYHWTWAYLSSYNDFSLTDNLGLTLNLYAATKNKSASYVSNARYWWSLGARLSLFKGKVDASLGWTQVTYNHGKIKAEGSDFTYTRRDLSSDSRLQLTVTWNFNAGRKIQRTNLPTINARDSREVPTF